MGNVSTTTPGPRATILVVEDYGPNLKLVANALAADGPYTILQAVDGIEAQEILRARVVDVVVSDVMMPRLDGLELMRWARAECPGPTWIIHSALDTFDAAVEALQLGAFDFVAKPLRSVRLIQHAVRNAVHARELEAGQRALRDTLAAQNDQLVAQITQLEELCRVLRQQADTIQHDLDRAELIQRALLPRMAPLVPGFAIDSLYRPSRSIGGDGYDLVRLDDRHVALYVTDAAGHGVAAAMLAVLVKHRLVMVDPITGRPRAPADVLAALNRVLVDECTAPGLFVTAVYCVLDIETGALAIASAGHPPVALHSGGEVALLERTGPALGLHADAHYREHSVRLRADDRLLIYTDGLCEPPATGAALGARAIATALRTDDRQGIAVLQALLATAIAGHGGRPLDDDVTLVMLTAADRMSTLDHDTPAARVAPAPAPAPVSAPASADAAPAAPPAELAIGDTADDTWVRVCGRVTWVHAVALHDACATARAAGRPLVIDLGGCTYLDSTVLGTLHELVAQRDAPAICVQGVRAEVRDLFEELAMQPVLDCIACAARAAPTAMRPLGGCEPTADSRDRILHAHEALAELSEHNREQFAGVVESLRATPR